MNKEQWVEKYIRGISQSSDDLSASVMPKLFEQKKDLIPKRLFKFDALPKEQENRDLRYSKLSAIKFSNIWMSNPERFNDPYDCMLGYDMDHAFVHESDVSKAEENFKISFKRTNDGVLLKDFSERMRGLLEEEHGPFDHQAYNEAIYEANSSLYAAGGTLRTTILISCFTEHRDNLPMWAHYSNNNSGYCLEYDFRENNSHDNWNSDCINQLYPVVYQDIRPNSSGQSGKDFEAVYYQTRFTKSKHWEYESEWRYINPFPYKNPSEIEQFGRLATAPKLTAIYLGMFMSDEDIEQLILMSSFQKIPVYKMRPDHGTFCFRPELLRDFR